MALDGGTPERLTTNGGSKSEVGLSPDGKIVSFLQGGDLWLRYMGTGDLVQATRVGVAPRGTVPLGTYYRPDVEIGRYTWGGDTPAYAWSPDGAYIAVQYVDRRKVRETPYPYYLGEETVANLHRRGYPGDDNEIRTIGFYGVASGELRLVDLAVAGVDSDPRLLLVAARRPAGRPRGRHCRRSLAGDDRSGVARTARGLARPPRQPRLHRHRVDLAQ